MKIHLNDLKLFILQFCIACLAILCCANGSCIPDEEGGLNLDPESLMNDDRPVEAVISIHKIIKYRRGEDSEKMVKSFFEDEVCVNRIQDMDSSEITSIEAVQVPDDEMYNLKLTLTEKGRKLWISLSIGNKGQMMAFLVDGILYRRFVPRLIYDDTTDSVIVDGPFDRDTAMKIASNSKRNFSKLGPKKSLLEKLNLQ